MALQIKKEKTYVYECWDIAENDMPNVIKKQVEYSSCYAMIKSISGTKNQLSMQVAFYSNANKEKIIECKQYGFEPSVSDGSTNFIQQGYEYLKTLPEFADAVDC